MNKELPPMIAYPIICAAIGAAIGLTILFVFGFAPIRVVIVICATVIGLLVGMLFGDSARRKRG